MTKSTPFEAALKEARKSLNEALEERRAIESRIVNLKKTIQGLAALCEPVLTDDLEQILGSLGNQYTSLTDAIRTVFSQSKEPSLKPPQVRDALVAMGFDLAKYKQPLVPIHNTLKRLESQEEIVAVRDERGDLAGYRWVSPLARAVAEMDFSTRMGPLVNLFEYKPDTPALTPQQAESIRKRAAEPMAPRTRHFRGITQGLKNK
jgi:hypothetical protein